MWNRTNIIGRNEKIMNKKMMVDVRVYSESGKMSFERYEIDDFEFCV